jgi:hypothetical protein
MIKIIKEKTSPQQIDCYSQYIDQIIGNKESNDPSYSKRVLETCHIAKFLTILDSTIEIFSKSENPDFIIRKKGKLIGVELETIVNQEFKKIEGSLKSLIADVEKEYKRTHSNEKRLFNIYLNDSIHYSKSNKTALVNKLLEIINYYSENQTLIENDLISDILMMDHSRLDFVFNTGAWWQRTLEIEPLLNAIHKKESRIDEYKLNSGADEQWLLLVIGGLGESSYEIGSTEFLNQPIDSKFNKVFILEDFLANIYELK